MLTKLKSEETVLAVRADAISIHVGEDAWELFSQEWFLADWNVLCETCSWTTVFQHQAFVITWYQTYRQKYLPIVVKKAEGGKLTGLLTLALSLAGNTKEGIIGAGQYEAEYQTWLTDAPGDEDFIKSAMGMVQTKFPRIPIQLRFIPPGVPLKWAKEFYWKSRCVLQEHSRPLMDLSDQDLTKKFRKIEFRNKLNRLKRLGELEFERITDKEQFEAILDELILHYEFRQGAMFNKSQFKDEPLKADFLLALFDQNLLHVSVLKINGQIFAAIVAITAGNWVHLGGINIHIPFGAKFYSPGFVHFILLAQQLVTEDIVMFDLTPGGDFYKERLANRHDQAYILVVTDNPFYWLKKQLRKAYENILVRAGKWPMGVDLLRRKKIYLLKARIRQARKLGFLKTLIIAIRNRIQPPEDQAYLLSSMPETNGTRLLLKQNSLSDLLQFEGKGSWMTRWEFLADAMHRFEVGQRSFTFSEDNRLLACVWFGGDTTSRPRASQLPEVEPAVMMLRGFYCHPAGEKKLKSFLAATTTALLQENLCGQLEARISRRDKIFCQALEAIGFTPGKT